MTDLHVFIGLGLSGFPGECTTRGDQRRRTDTSMTTEELFRGVSYPHYWRIFIKICLQWGESIGEPQWVCAGLISHLQPSITMPSALSFCHLTVLLLSLLPQVHFNLAGSASLIPLDGAPSHTNHVRGANSVCVTVKTKEKAATWKCQLALPVT